LFKKSIFAIAALFIITIASILTSECQQEKPSPTLEKGIGQYKHENYDEAVVTLKKAREENPTSTLGAYYLGLAYKQIQDYRQAVPSLRDAVTYSPKIKGALIELIDCLYQLDQLEEAMHWINEAEKEGIRPAQVAFLKGLVLMKQDDKALAVSAFEDAKALDSSMTQACNYQIGICRLKEGKFSDASKAFQQVVIVDPTSNMANFANEYMQAIERKKEVDRPLRLSFGTAWQYDDNVILKPTDDTLVGEIADKADSREVYTATAEYNHRVNDKFSLKTQYLFYYAKQNNLGFYDMVSNTFAVQPALNIGNGLLSFPLTYNHTLVNDKAYLSSPGATSVYNVMIGTSMMVQAHLKYIYKDYLWEPTSVDEDRTGNEIGGGIGWYLFYAKNKGFLNLRYALNREWTDGMNWRYIGNRASATLLMPLLEKLNLTVSGDMFFQNFTNSHSVFNVYRKDNVYTLSSLLAYKIYKDSEIQLQYTFVKDDSNVSVYRYNRNVYSAGVDIKF